MGAVDVPNRDKEEEAGGTRGEVKCRCRMHRVPVLMSAGSEVSPTCCGEVFTNSHQRQGLHSFPRLVFDCQQTLHHREHTRNPDILTLPVRCAPARTTEA